MSERSATVEKKSQTSHKLKWRRYFAFLVIFIVLIYLLSLVLLNTSWAKNKLTNKFNQKSNTEWEVGSVLWIPFGDIELNNLQTKMGDGGIQIKSLSVEPSWQNLFSGELRLMGATAKGAEVDLDLKWLKENSNNDAEIITRTKPKTTKPTPKITPKKPTKPPVNPTTPKQPQKPVSNPVVTEIPKIDTSPNRWLTIEKLNVTVRNGDEVIDQITDITASIPYAGKPAEGGIQLKFHDYEHKVEIHWDGKELHAEDTEGEIFNVKYQWKIACKLNQRGSPFAFIFNVPQQKLNYIHNKPNLHLSLTSDKIATSFMLNGSLKNPLTWRGLLNAQTGRLIITENQKTHKRLEFDHTHLVGSIANGAIHIPSAEAIGHKTSILANGVIHKNLYSYGVVRLITNEEARGFYEGVYHATKLIHIDQNSYHFLFPLDTPERRYCDLYLDGKLTDLEIRHNRSNSWQPLNILIKKLFNFKNNELAEDGLLESAQ
ncbi:MAG: hypothetical protein ACSHX6_11945 [Akkermansiaceae bacterium]